MPTEGFEGREDEDAFDVLCSLAGGKSGDMLWRRFGGLSFGVAEGGGCSISVSVGACDGTVDVSCSDVCVGAVAAGDSATGCRSVVGGRAAAVDASVVVGVEMAVVCNCSGTWSHLDA